MQYVAGCIKGGTLPAVRGAPSSRAVCSTRINSATLTLLLKKLLFFLSPPSSQSELVVYHVKSFHFRNTNLRFSSLPVASLLVLFYILSTFEKGFKHINASISCDQ